ncbi:MAG: MarR family transcriptional regulator [Hyphomicrobiaceae bacterium]|nr:MarR family transcriptional regulator [Hyphomicrobiaceae bacterium]
MNDDDAYLNRSLGFLLADASRLVRKRFDDRAASLGLTRAQWRVIAQLRRREGINQAALAEILEIEPITLVRHIDRLEAKGFVERRPDPNDRRARTLHLLDDAQPVMAQMRAFSLATRQEALQGITAEEIEKLIDQLITIKENMANLPPLPEVDELTERKREKTAQES